MTEIGEKQKDPAYIWGNNEITDILNTHDTGRQNTFGDDPENVPDYSPRINADMTNLNTWMSDAANADDKEPERPQEDVVAELTAL